MQTSIYLIDVLSHLQENKQMITLYFLLQSHVRGKNKKSNVALRI